MAELEWAVKMVKLTIASGRRSRIGRGSKRVTALKAPVRVVVFVVPHDATFLPRLERTVAVEPES